MASEFVIFNQTRSFGFFISEFWILFFGTWFTEYWEHSNYKSLNEKYIIFSWCSMLLLKIRPKSERASKRAHPTKCFPTLRARHLSRVLKPANFLCISCLCTGFFSPYFFRSVQRSSRKDGKKLKHPPPEGPIPLPAPSSYSFFLALSTGRGDN